MNESKGREGEEKKPPANRNDNQIDPKQGLHVDK